MKKLTALLLVVFVCLTLVACGSKKDDTSAPDASNKVKEYVDENGEAFLEGFEQGFESSGLTCTSSIKAEGNGIVITVCINELVDVTGDVKAQLQSTYDADTSAYESVLAQLQGEVPELETMTYRICEKDGDILATIKVGK